MIKGCGCACVCTCANAVGGKSILSLRFISLSRHRAAENAHLAHFQRVKLI